MCRYIAYLGKPLALANILYKPSNGLIHQASDAMESRTRINADGFGIGWYNMEVSREPAWGPSARHARPGPCRLPHRDPGPAAGRGLRVGAGGRRSTEPACGELSGERMSVSFRESRVWYKGRNCL